MGCDDDLAQQVCYPLEGNCAEFHHKRSKRHCKAGREQREQQPARYAVFIAGGQILPIIAPYIQPLKKELEKLGADRDEIVEATEIEIKYSGYIEREKELAEKMIRLENIRIKDKFNYNNIESLSTEARQKLTAINPETLAQASRIPGVSPSDINVLLVLMRK